MNDNQLMKSDFLAWSICAICAICIVATIFIAYPVIWGWVSENSSSIASWVQAIGSIAAIFATWYITSRQKQFEVERDYRLAAIESSTMHAELWMVIGSLEKSRKSAQEILDDQSAYHGAELRHLNDQIKIIVIRPLNTQGKLVSVGEGYLNQMYGILEDLEMIKIGVEDIIQIIPNDPHYAYVQLGLLVEEIKYLQQKILPVCYLLGAYSQKYGIILKDKKIDVEAFEEDSFLKSRQD